MRHCVLLALCLASSPQEGDKSQSATEFLAAVETAYLGAETLQWKGTFKIEKITAGDSKEVGSAEVEAVFKKGNRVRFQLKSKEDGAEIRSDGAALFFNPGRRPHRGKTPKSLDANVRVILLRAGVEMASLSRAIRQDLDLDTVAKRLSISEIRWGSQEKVDGTDVKTVQYKLTAVVDERQTVYKVKLWVDPKTHHIVRRVTDLAEQGLRITETYASTLINAKVDDAQFSVPQEKKK